MVKINIIFYYLIIYYLYVDIIYCEITKSEYSLLLCKDIQDNFVIFNYK